MSRSGPAVPGLRRDPDALRRFRGPIGVRAVRTGEETLLAARVNRIMSGDDAGRDRATSDAGATFEEETNDGVDDHAEESARGLRRFAAPGTGVPPLWAEELRKMDAYWRAANYLSVGQIYLMDNPLLKEPLQLKHVKPRLLGHWGTTPGLNFLYVHLNRVIKEHDLNMHLHLRPRARRAGAGGQRLPGRDLQRGLPQHRPGRGGPEAALHAVLVPRRHPQPRRPGDARLASTRAASWATPCRTPTAPPSTTPT